MNLAMLAIIFIIGILFGSFLNVCAYRIPKKKSIIWGRSQCPHCGHKIPFYYNIPIISFFILKGRCHYCGQKISWQYPLIEFLTGFLTVVLYYKFGLTGQFIFYLVFTYFLIVIALIDWETQLILNKVLVIFLSFGIIINLIGQVISFKDAAIGALVGGSVMFLVAYVGNRVFKKEAMGMGDVKLAFVSGFFIGWHFILWALYLGFLIALLGIGIAWIMRRQKLPTSIPMGPFFAIGFIMHLFYGQQLFVMYLKLFS